MSAILEAAREVYRVGSKNGGLVPECLVRTSKEYHELAVEVLNASSYANIGDRKHPLHVCGVPVIVHTFADDPLFKQLQAMAALAGAEIRYQTYQQEVLGALFTSACGGWKYLPADHCLGGKSMLHPVDESGLPLDHPYARCAA